MAKLSQKNDIPYTRLRSWSEFNSSGQKTSIKKYILELLHDSGVALTRRDICTISGIEQQSLTRPLLELTISGDLNTDTKVKSTTNRLVIAYRLKNGLKTVKNGSNV